VLLRHPLGAIRVLGGVPVTFGVAPSFRLSFGCPDGDSCLANKIKTLRGEKNQKKDRDDVKWPSIGMCVS
jgi:hypothetical protein